MVGVSLFLLYKLYQYAGTRTDFPTEEARARAEGVDLERLAADTARRWAELMAR